ncbi:MAG TPA: aminotransferase class I/II-fold pyridoxal phosphate-dependent enzyme, partial [Candidatus Elarobacter sp.]
MIPFNKPFETGDEFRYIAEAIAAGHLSGDGRFTRLAQEWLERETGAHRALLTHSCTAALEMSALLADVGPGDEVVMPSYTFVSTANAFVLRGATPVFVDVRPDTLNLDERLAGDAITPRTKAIVAVHYAGVACEMDELTALAGARGLVLIEDAAQELGSTYRGTPLGAIGDLAALSFHETKNVISGEGGALLVREDGPFAERAEIIREKGTNR